MPKTNPVFYKKTQGQRQLIGWYFRFACNTLPAAVAPEARPPFVEYLFPVLRRRALMVLCACRSGRGKPRFECRSVDGGAQAGERDQRNRRQARAALGQHQPVDVGLPAHHFG